MSVKKHHQLHYELAQSIADGLTESEVLSAIPKLQRLPKSEQTAKCAGRFFFFFGMNFLRSPLTRKILRIEELRSSVQLLMAVSRALKARRVDVGALQLESSEIRVKFDANHKTVADLVAKVWRYLYQFLYIHILRRIFSD